MTQIWSEIWKEVIKWWKKVWFEAKLTARLKMIELENQWESEQERKERFEPIYQEKEVDNELVMRLTLFSTSAFLTKVSIF